MIAKRGYERIGFASYGQGQGWSAAVGGFLMFQDKVKPSCRARPFLISDPGLLQKQFEDWLRQEKPDAILTDLIDVPQALQRAGYTVPKDVGLASLNVSDIDADAGIYQFPEETGQIAVETLLSLIYHNHRGIPEVPREVLVCGRWQDGKSLPQRG